MWLIFALLGGLLYTVQGLMSRHLLKGAQKDVWAFSFYFSLVGALVSLPFMLAAPVVPSTLGPWLVGLLAACLIVGQNWLVFSAMRYIGPSLSGSISKFRLVWVFGLSVLVLGTGFSWQKLLGTLFVVTAGLVIMKHFSQPQSYLGVGFAFGASLLFAVVIIIYKLLFPAFNAPSLTFFVAFLPPLLINFMIMMPRAWQRIRALYQENSKLVVVACALGALANLALNQGLAIGEASSVLVVVEACLVVTLVGEHIFLKEKEQTWVKTTSVGLAVVGAVLIQLAS